MANWPVCLYLDTPTPWQSAENSLLKPAVFFDRDGTLIKSVHYLRDPDQVELIEGAAELLKALANAGYLRIIVTNQAAIGKGLLDQEGLVKIQQKLEQLLQAQEASVNAWYFCPEVRISDDFETIDFVDRKPGPGMLLKAAQDFDICLSQSWMIGDMLSDTIAGRNAGCKGNILIRSGAFKPEYKTHPSVDYVVDHLFSVKDIILRA